MPITFLVHALILRGSCSLGKFLKFRGSLEKSLSFKNPWAVLERRDGVHLTHNNTVIFWGIISFSDMECHHKS